MNIKIVNYDRDILMKELGQEYLRAVQDRFDTQGKSDGGEEWKPSKKTSGKTLEESGALRHTTYFTIKGSIIDIINPKVYANIHNFGGEIHIGIHSRRGRGETIITMPKREFIPSAEAIKERLLKTIKRIITGKEE